MSTPLSLILSPDERKTARQAVAATPAGMPHRDPILHGLKHAPTRLDGAYVLRGPGEWRNTLRAALVTFSKTTGPRAGRAATLALRIPAPPHHDDWTRAHAASTAIPGLPLTTFEVLLLGVAADGLRELAPIWPDAYQDQILQAARTLAYACCDGLIAPPSEILARFTRSPVVDLRNAASCLASLDRPLPRFPQEFKSALRHLQAYAQERTVRESN